MRTLKNLPVPQDGNDALFPDGQIRNETTTESGTPVVRELYGDILTNIYKIVKDAGVSFNELEDSEANGYQLLDALKKFANELNDLNQVLTVSGTSISVNFNLDNLPNKYIFIGTLSDALVSGQNYTLSGTGFNTFSLASSQNILASSVVLITLQGSVISISPIQQQEPQKILTPFSGVLTANNTDTTYYLSDGYLINNTPISKNIQQTIRVGESDNTMIVYDAVIHKNKLLVLSKPQAANNYKFYIFELSDLSTYVVSATAFGNGSNDFLPSLYVDIDDVYMYLSNAGNTSANDYEINTIEFDNNANTFSDVGTLSLDANFQKTSNAFVRNDNFYTYVSGELYRYPFDGSARVFELFVNNINGRLFVQDGVLYFTSGEIAVPWNV